AVHAAWLIALWIFGHAQPLNALALACYMLLQLLRGWVMWTLGGRWTTRILVLPGEVLVTRGPYRYLSHPNYAVVAGEIALLPLAPTRPGRALLFSVLTAAVLTGRIRTESRALAAAASRTASST